MTGKLPLFVSAPRCRIKVGDQTIAYAVGLSLGVNLLTEQIKTLGYFTIRSIEPLMVSPVSGSLRIVRLLSDTTRAANASAAGNYRTSFVPDAATAAAATAARAASGEDPIGDVNMQSAVGVAGGSSILSQGALYRHMDPASLLLSQTLTLDMWLKVPVVADGDYDPTTGIIKAGTYDLVDTRFMTIQDVRLTAGSGSFTPNRIYEESFQYQGLLCISHYDAAGQPVQALDTSWQEQPGLV